MADAGFDPDEPESSKRRSAYLSGKDFKVLAIVLVVLFLISLPIYNYYHDISEKFKCKRNLKDIFECVNLYAAEWNDRYPPLYVVAPDSKEAPMLDSEKRPFTWGSLIQRFAKNPSMLVCPSAESDEILVAQHPMTTTKGLPMSYGMYVGLAAQPSGMVRSPNSTILISETSNSGANQTYNPVPLKDDSGQPVPYDGFMIGYNTGNLKPTPTTEFVTRLAYQGTAKGSFSKQNAGRHFGANLFLFASGQVATLTAEAARVKMLGSRPTDPWETP